MPAAAQGPADAGLLIGRVLRVLDGDSLVLQQGRHEVSVRLAAVDAPERDQAHAEAARAALRACAGGRIVMVQVTATDRHGRRVGRLESAGEDCGLRLVRQGHAWHAKAFEREQPLGDRLAYAAAQREARRQRLGLWQDPNPTPPWAWRREFPRTPGA